MTWRTLLQFGKQALPGEEAAWEAWLLFAEVFQTTRAEFLLKEDAEVTQQQAMQYQSFLERRKMGEPVAYILQNWEFMGLSFKVTPAVLIPRQDTETLVEAALEWTPREADILDLCTGSGCIAVSLAHYLPQARVDAADLSVAALEIAAHNAKENGVHVSFWQGDLWEALPAGRQYNLITANPPYIDASQYKALDRDVREFEPKMALYGGEDGLAFYWRLAERTASFLKEGGRAYWEIGYDQGKVVADIVRKRGLKLIEVRKDLAGHDRVVIAEKETAYV